MDVIAYLISFIVVMMQLFGKGDPDPIILTGGLIGIGLCSIAGAINDFWRNKK